jgi:DNA-binding CsgD family transcriptional regulator
LKLPLNFHNPIPAPDTPVLSPREREVVTLLGRQMSTAQIASAMSISVNTVRTRKRRALRKLGLEGRQEARQAAHDLGLG